MKKDGHRFLAAMPSKRIQRKVQNATHFVFTRMHAILPCR